MLENVILKNCERIIRNALVPKLVSRKYVAFVVKTCCLVVSGVLAFTWSFQRRFVSCHGLLVNLMTIITADYIVNRKILSGKLTIDRNRQLFFQKANHVIRLRSFLALDCNNTWKVTIHNYYDDYLYSGSI